jgi:hypothetical protein
MAHRAARIERTLRERVLAAYGHAIEAKYRFFPGVEIDVP